MVARRSPRRAGGRAIALLADGLDMRVLSGLVDGPIALSPLRRAVGAPPPTTLRNHLRRLEDAGLLARCRADDFPRQTKIGLLEPGRRLLSVADRLTGWLALRPNGSVLLGTPTSHAVLTALVDGWSSSVIRALADAPLSLVQLDRRIPGLDYPTVVRRIDALKVAGLVQARRPIERVIPYAPTDWLGRAILPLVEAARWEREASLSPPVPVRAADVEAALLLAAPRIRVAAEISGNCRLVVAFGDRAAAGVVLRIDRGRVVTMRTDLSHFATASISGGVAAWTSAVLDSEPDGLIVRGNHRLARPVLDSLSRRGRV